MLQDETIIQGQHFLRRSVYFRGAGQRHHRSREGRMGFGSICNLNWFGANLNW
jgi:hypothetical protein